jgi:hypothetical protein
VIQRKYTLGELGTPLLVDWGIMENPIIFEGWNSRSFNKWSISGFVHTHPRGDDKFSASRSADFYDPEFPIGGDIGMATRGYNVYLVPTSSSVLRQIYFISGETLYKAWWSSVGKAEREVNQMKETLKLD